MVKRSIIITLLLILSHGYDITCEYSNPPPARPIVNYRLNDKEELIGTIYPGVSFIIDLNDAYLSVYYKKYGYETYIRYFSRFLKEGDVLLNIGAHLGFESMVFGKIIGPKGKIFFFEPNEVTRNILTKNIYLNDYQDISTIYPVAVGNKKMTAYLMVNLGNTGASVIETEESLSKFKGRMDAKKEVQVDLVDNVLPKDLVANFAFVDVEMLEVECLEGMKEIIKRSPDLSIAIEWSGRSEHWPQDEYIKHFTSLLDWF